MNALSVRRRSLGINPGHLPSRNTPRCSAALSKKVPRHRKKAALFFLCRGTFFCAAALFSLLVSTAPQIQPRLFYHHEGQNGPAREENNESVHGMLKLQRTFDIDIL